MENVNLSESKTLEFKDCSRKLLEWFEETGNLSIANYQRPYAWTESLIVNFTENILKAITKVKDGQQTCVSPDIGLIVIEKHQDKEFIADGQQRLLTMALIFQEVGTQEGKPLVFPEDSRLMNLLNSSVLNLQTYRHIAEARKFIKNSLSMYDNLFLESFKSVTFAVTELSCINNQTDPWIIKLFEDINTSGKQLNGGQILKAYHLGKIRQREGSSITKVQAMYEQWRKKPSCGSGLKLGLNRFHLKCFNDDQTISLDEFVDSANDRYQAAWYWLGYGFVQSVQAILLKHSNWWHPIAQQGQERIYPFDRLEGCLNSKKFERWSARSPLEFTVGDDYFSTINRFALLYNDFYIRLQKMANRENTTINDAMSGTDIAFEADAFTPGELVIHAAKMVSSYMSSIEQYHNKKVSSEGVNWGLVRIPKTEIFDPSWKDPFDLLGLVPAVSELGASDDPYVVERKPNQRELSNGNGGLCSSIFANALCWADYYGMSQDKNFYTSLTPAQANIIVSTLAIQIICVRCSSKRYDSMLLALQTDEFQDAAQVSPNVEGAQWRFIRRSYSRLSKIRPHLESLLSYGETCPDKNNWSDDSKAFFKILKVFVNQ